MDRFELAAERDRKEHAKERAVVAAAAEKEREENAKARAEAAVKGDAMMAFLVGLQARMDASDKASKGTGSL
jgi:cbb3-type cytochrome oxidase cytochrome c subunit